MKTIQVNKNELLEYTLNRLAEAGFICNEEDKEIMVKFATNRANALKKEYDKERYGFGDEMWGAFFEDGLVIGRFIDKKYSKRILNKLESEFDNDVVDFVEIEMREKWYSKMYL